jgi:hypothetical protein
MSIPSLSLATSTVKMNRACFINLSAVDPMATEIAEALKVVM